jgi:hypothetical protein
MFRAVPLPIIKSYPLYIRHWHMLYSFDDSLRAGSGWNVSCSTNIDVPSWQKSYYNFYILLPSILLWFLVNGRIDARFFSMYLFQFSTCFEQPCAHHQENQFYQYNSWWWARGCSKHVENWNKYIEKNCTSSCKLLLAVSNSRRYSFCLFCNA